MQQQSAFARPASDGSGAILTADNVVSLVRELNSASSEPCAALPGTNSVPDIPILPWLRVFEALLRQHAYLEQQELNVFV